MNILLAAGFLYIDNWYFLLILPALFFSLIVQAVMNRIYQKYSGVLTSRGISGADAARRVLMMSSVYGVGITPVDGTLTDHFDPRDNNISLSIENYNGRSIAAVGVAAHEAGHAIQASENFMPLTVRNSLVPVANFAVKVSWWLFLLGLILGIGILSYIGIALFACAALFHMVTLPVEIDASRRALKALKSSGSFSNEELKGVKKVLSAAAMTYVAALVSSLVSLFRMLLLFRGGSGRRR